MTTKKDNTKKSIHKRTFSLSEINHIVKVLKENERLGEYYGNKEQYWKRHQNILDKLLN